MYDRETHAQRVVFASTCIRRKWVDSMFRGTKKAINVAAYRTTAIPWGGRPSSGTRWRHGELIAVDPALHNRGLRTIP